MQIGRGTGDRSLRLDCAASPDPLPTPGGGSAPAPPGQRRPCAVGGSGRSNVAGSATMAAADRRVSGSATDARVLRGSGARSGGVAGGSGIAPGSAGCASGSTGTRVSAPLSGGLASDVLPKRRRHSSDGSLTRRRRFGRSRGHPTCRLRGRSNNSAYRGLVGRRTVSGLPDPIPIDVRNVFAQVSGISAARLGHDPLDEFRAQSPGVDAHVAPALGCVVGFEARGRHSHCAFAEDGDSGGNVMASCAATPRRLVTDHVLSVGHREGVTCGTVPM